MSKGLRVRTVMTTRLGDLLLFFASLSSLCVAARTCKAEPQDLPVAFHAAAEAWRANFDKLKTWQGEVLLVLETFDDELKEPITIEATVTYQCDLEHERSRYEISITKDVVGEGNKERPRMPLEVRSGMSRNGAHYSLVYKPNQASRAALIKENRDPPGFTYDTFDPLYYFTYGGSPWDEYWLSLAAGVKDNPDFHGSVDVKEEQMLYVRRIGDHKATFHVDLKRGGNLVDYLTVVSSDQQSESSKLEITWDQHDNVWTPTTLVQSYKATKPKPSQRTFRLTWKKQTVNKPIDESEFSEKSLGLRPGDQVQDSRIHESHTIH